MSATKETIIEAYSPPNPELWLSQLPFEELDLACEDILSGISRDDRFFADNTTEDVERLVREVGTLRIALRNGFQGMRTVDRSLLPGTPAIELEFNGPIDGDDASQYVLSVLYSRHGRKGRINTKGLEGADGKKIKGDVMNDNPGMASVMMHLMKKCGDSFEVGPQINMLISPHLNARVSLLHGTLKNVSPLILTTALPFTDPAGIMQLRTSIEKGVHLSMEHNTGLTQTEKGRKKSQAENDKGDLHAEETE